MTKTIKPPPELSLHRDGVWVEYRRLIGIQPILAMALGMTETDAANPALAAILHTLWLVQYPTPALVQFHHDRIPHGAQYTYAELRRARKVLTEMNLVVIDPGMSGVASSIYHTSKLVAVFDKMRMATVTTDVFEVGPDPRTNTCLVRDEDEVETRLNASPQNKALVSSRTSIMRAQEALRASQRLVGIRRHLSAHVAAQCVPVDRESPIDDDQLLILPAHLMTTYCIFHRRGRRPVMGGRQNYALQSMLSSEQRRHLMVRDQDGVMQATAEVDIVCAQPRILFALAGAQMPSEDLYEHIRTHGHHTISRTHAKALMMYVIGAESPTYRGYRACRAARALTPVDGQMTREHYQWVWDEVLAPVRHLLDGPTWGHLQRAESDWLFEVLSRLSERGVAAWTWHDSIRVADEHVEVLREAMEAAWAALFGTTPIVTTTDRGVAAIPTQPHPTSPSGDDHEPRIQEARPTPIADYSRFARQLHPVAAGKNRRRTDRCTVQGGDSGRVGEAGEEKKDKKVTSHP